MSKENEEFIDVIRNGKEFCYKDSEPGKLLCRKCHSVVYEDSTRCPNCNNNLVVQKDESTYSTHNSNNNAGDSEYVYIPDEYTPISMWGYFGYEILFNIPIIGWIILIVMAISSSNENVKNFARAHFCVLVIIAIAIALGAGSLFRMLMFFR